MRGCPSDFTLMSMPGSDSPACRVVTQIQPDSGERKEGREGGMKGGRSCPCTEYAQTFSSLNNAVLQPLGRICIALGVCNKSSRNDLKYAGGEQRSDVNTTPFYTGALSMCRFWYLQSARANLLWTPRDPCTQTASSYSWCLPCLFLHPAFASNFSSP